MCILIGSGLLRQCVQTPDSTACGPPLLPLPFAIPCLAQPRIPYTCLNHLSSSRSPLSILLYCASWQKSLQTRSPLVAVQLCDCDQLLRGELTLPGGRDVGWVTGYTVISPYHRLLSRHCFMYDHVTMAHIFSSSLVSFPPTYPYLHISVLMRSLRIQLRNYLLSSISLHYLSWSGPSIAWGLSWHSFVRVRAHRPRITVLGSGEFPSLHHEGHLELVHGQSSMQDILPLWSLARNKALVLYFGTAQDGYSGETSYQLKEDLLDVIH